MRIAWQSNRSAPLPTAMRKSAPKVGVRELLQERGVQAVKFLADLMSDPDAKPELRFKAAEKILDRALEEKESAAHMTESQVVRFEGVLDEWSR